MEYETLDREEVEKVIRGESIRSITEVLREDMAELERQEGDSTSSTTQAEPMVP